MEDGSRCSYSATDAGVQHSTRGSNREFCLPPGVFLVCSMSVAGVKPELKRRNPLFTSRNGRKLAKLIH
jgi:hypothetical protein